MIPTPAALRTALVLAAVLAGGSHARAGTTVHLHNDSGARVQIHCELRGEDREAYLRERRDQAGRFMVYNDDEDQACFLGAGQFLEAGQCMAFQHAFKDGETGWEQYRFRVSAEEGGAFRDFKYLPVRFHAHLPGYGVINFLDRDFKGASWSLETRFAQGAAEAGHPCGHRVDHYILGPIARPAKGEAAKAETKAETKTETKSGTRQVRPGSEGQ